MTYIPHLEPREGEDLLDTIGRYIAENMTNQMRRDLTDAFILMTSLDTAAPYITQPDNLEMEHDNDNQE